MLRLIPLTVMLELIVMSRPVSTPFLIVEAGTPDVPKVALAN